MDFQALANSLFAVSRDIRYVAAYRNASLQIAERSGIANASGAESDRYEELLVNPTLLTLTRQRGDIDCGGLDFLLVRYGHFFQLVHPISGGHLSVAIEPAADPLALAPMVRRVATEQGFLRAT